MTKSQMIEYAYECNINCERCGNDTEWVDAKLLDSGKQPATSNSPAIHWIEFALICKCGVSRFVSDSN